MTKQTEDHPQSKPYLKVVCHDIMSLNNLGSIFRTADGAGFDEIILSGICGSPPQRGLTKVSLGAEHAVAWQKVDTVDDILELIETDLVIACEQTPNSIKYNDLVLDDILEANFSAFPENVTVIVGSEREGTDPALLERADICLEVPMRGSKESLNVAIAFALVGYAVADTCILEEAHDREVLRGHLAETDRVRNPGILTNGITHGETPTVD